MNDIDIKKLLENKSKADLLKLIQNLVQSTPSLVSTIKFYLSNTNQTDIIDLEPITRKISRAVYGDLDYYHIDGAVEELYEVQKHAETLYKNSEFKSAAEIYFLLVEGCVDAYNEGADDSSGGMGFLGEECISDFNKCMKEVKDESFKTEFIDRILELYWREDYGFNIEMMFEGTVSQANIHKLEEEFEDHLEMPKDDHHFDYRRNSIRKMMINLYNLIEMPEKSLQIALKGLATADDYRMAAEKLLELQKYKDALEHALNGLKMNESHRLFELYFDIIDSLIHTKQNELIDINEAMTWAIKYISSFSIWNFNVEKYRKICDLFSGLKSRDLFKEKMFNTLKGEILVKVLLEEGEILKAVEVLKKSNLKGRLPSLAMTIARKAKKNDLKDITRKMIILAIQSGLSYLNREDDHLIRETLDKHSIEEIINSTPDNLSKEISLLLAEVASVKAPHIIRELIKNAENYKGKELLPICKNLVEQNPEDAMQLCEEWISTFVIRSHVYYDDVISMLLIIKRALNQRKEEWTKYLSNFMSKYKSRKKLITMIQDANLT